MNIENVVDFVLMLGGVVFVITWATSHCSIDDGSGDFKGKNFLDRNIVGYSGGKPVISSHSTTK